MSDFKAKSLCERNSELTCRRVTHVTRDGVDCSVLQLPVCLKGDTSLDHSTPGPSELINQIWSRFTFIVPAEIKFSAF